MSCALFCIRRRHDLLVFALVWCELVPVIVNGGPAQQRLGSLRWLVEPDVRPPHPLRMTLLNGQSKCWFDMDYGLWKEDLWKEEERDEECLIIWIIGQS